MVIYQRCDQRFAFMFMSQRVRLSSFHARFYRHRLSMAYKHLTTRAIVTRDVNE